MALTAKAGTPLAVQFTLFGVDEFTRLPGEAANVVAELSRSNATGTATEPTGIVPSIAERGDIPGEYYASFTPAAGDAGRTYFLVLRHALSFADIEETIQIFANDIDDVAAAVLLVEGFLVSVSGGPYGKDQPLVVTWTFRNRQTLSPFDPFDIARVELIGLDGTTIIQTILGPALTNLGVGVRRGTFFAVPNLGDHFIKVFFTPQAGDPQLFDVHPLFVQDLTAAVVSGIISVADLLECFLGIVPGVDNPFDILKELNPDTKLMERLIPDSTIACAIRRQAAYVEKALDVKLMLTRFACRPDVVVPGNAPLVKGVDYDEEVDPLDMQWPHRGSHLGVLSFPQRHVQRVTRARILYGATPLFEIPERWFNLQRKTGTARIIVDAADFEISQSAVVFQTFFGYVLGHGTGGGRNWPMLWCLDFEAGLTDLPDDLQAVVAWRAIAEILPVAARAANRRATQSQSTGKDGLSRSQSVSDAGPGGRFAAILDSALIKEWTSEDMIDRLRRRHKGAIKVF